MRIIITGGSGLIGRELTATLTKDGYEVIVLSRSPQKVSGLPQGARAEKWDAESAAGWGHLADGAKAIINLAGEGIADGRWTAARKHRILQSRINAGKAVVEAVQKATTKPEVVIQASGIDYYGDRGSEPITEEASPQQGQFLPDVAIAWEQSVRPIADMVRLVIIRSGIVLTTKGGAFPQIMLPFKLFGGGPIGSGQQWWSWIHIEDEINAIKFLLENENAHGAFNLTAPNPLPNKAFAKALGQAMNRPSLVPAPAFALKLALGEMSNILLYGRRALPQKLLALGFQFAHPEALDAFKDLLAHNK